MHPIPTTVNNSPRPNSSVLKSFMPNTKKDNKKVMKILQLRQIWTNVGLDTDSIAQ